MYSLGSFIVGQVEAHVGVKLPILDPHRTAEDRVLQRMNMELGAMNDLTLRAPDLRPLLPKFLITASVASVGVIGILTEDATKGGEARLLGGRDGKVEAAIRDAYAVEVEKEGRHIICDGAFSSMMFHDGTVTRLLDFTPPPIWPGMISINKGYEGSFRYGVAAQGVVNIALAPGSKFSQDCSVQIEKLREGIA